VSDAETRRREAIARDTGRSSTKRSSSSSSSSAAAAAAGKKRSSLSSLSAGANDRKVPPNARNARGGQDRNADGSKRDPKDPARQPRNRAVLPGSVIYTQQAKDEWDSKTWDL
jgi:hypothetical protein